EAEITGPARHHWANVAVLLVVDLDGAEDRLDHLLFRQRDFQLDVPGALEQALDVFLEAEDLAVVDADALENAVAIEQAVVVDAALGVGFVVILAVDVDLGCHGRDPRSFTVSRETG